MERHRFRRLRKSAECLDDRDSPPPGFPPKSDQSVGTISVVDKQSFQRHDAARMALACPINHAHSATPDFLDDLVITNSPIGVAQIDSSQTCFERVRVFVDWCESRFSRHAGHKPLLSSRDADPQVEHLWRKLRVHPDSRLNGRLHSCLRARNNRSCFIEIFVFGVDFYFKRKKFSRSGRRSSPEFAELCVRRGKCGAGDIGSHHRFPTDPNRLRDFIAKECAVAQSELMDNATHGSDRNTQRNG